MAITDADVFAELQAGMRLLKEQRYALLEQNTVLRKEIFCLRERIRELSQKDIIKVPSQLPDILGGQKQVEFPDKLKTKKV